MIPPARSGLNETGEDGGAVVVRRGATHTSRAQKTSPHAHWAWKIHIGVDAPVWVRSPGRPADEARVIVVPPNVEHATGAVGWSLALFVEPGTRSAPWRESSGAFSLEGASAARLVRIADEALRASGPDVAAVVDEVARTTFHAMPRAASDARVRAALSAIEDDTHVSLARLAASLGVSVDRLTHLVSTQTGMPPRRHALWQRVLRVLEAGAAPATLAAAALDAGFADHAHMTRTFRRFLGRVPSEFRAPPEVVAPWRDAVSRAGGRR